MFTLLQWQWNGYAEFHRSRRNLLIHIVVVPLFWIANIQLIVQLVHHAYVPAIFSGLAMAFSLAMQGRGHKLESTPSIPFSSPLNAVMRLLLEQWINFPRFVLSGAWWRAWKLANSN